MRKYMAKEVTFTKFQVAKMEMIKGAPSTVELESETVIGNVSLERATKDMTQKYNTVVMVYNLETYTTTYKMSVEDFIKHAIIDNDTPEPETEQETKE